MILSSLPPDDCVHIYCLSLPHTPQELLYIEQLLSPVEEDRAASLKSDQVRKRFIAGRGVLREILGRYLGIDPVNVPLTSGEHGKPFLADGGCTLRFNLSHTGDVLLLAITNGLEVGIDIEKIDHVKPIRDMARIAMSSREQEQIFSLSSNILQTEAFYRCWVRKEACLKASGSGFSLSSNSFDVSPLGVELQTLEACCNQTRWQVLDVDAPDGYCAALAVEDRGSAFPAPTPIRVFHQTRGNVFKGV